MIKASEIRKKVERHKNMAEEKLRAEEQQKKQDEINRELLEVEKTINGFDIFASRSSLDLRIANAKYITVPILVSRDVMLILEKEGYYVKLDIHGRKTYLYFNNERWMGTLDDSNIMPCKNTLTTLDNDKTNLKTELHNSKVEDECMVTIDDLDDLFKNCIIYRF